jgi:hypothetical protein
MEKIDKDISLHEDLKLVDTLLNKEVLQNWEQLNQKVPTNYFNAFEANTIHKIQTLKPTAKILNVYNWKTMAIAASFIAIVVSTYLFIPSNSNQLKETTALNIQQIPTEEIAAYIIENDLVAEVDWESDFNLENLEITNTYSKSKNDSN